MPSSEPQVTVLMPVRNGAAHLRAALESILTQTLADFELLVIDDGSADATPEILRAVRDPRLRIITNPQNLGLVPTLNLGLELARGQFVARQDHDDISMPRRLQKQAAFLRAHPDCALVGTEAVQVGEQGRKAFRLLRPRGAESIRWYLCFDNAFIHSSVMFRREMILREFGGYPRCFHSEDYALWSHVARLRSTANLPEPLLRYREHASSVTGSMSQPDVSAFDEATTAIRWENLRALFGDRVTMKDARILSTYRRGFSAESAGQFLRVFDRLAAAHSTVVKDAAEFRRVRSIQLAELAYRLLPVARWQALALYRRALALHPALVGLLPWPRIAALFLLGEGARKIFLTITGRR
jgi:glycosyltransferase involved in cell wall biosynthesis